jgi:hypothetical protein
MSGIFKRVSDQYTITNANISLPTNVTIGGSSITNLTVGGINNNAQMVVNGNLIVTGTQYILNSITSTVQNSEIVLNAGIDQNTYPTQNASLSVDRGNQNTVSIMWNEVARRWMLTNDGIHYTGIASQISGGYYLSAVLDDPTPTLGNTLVTNGYSITSLGNTDVKINPGSGYLKIDSVIKLPELVTGPTANIAGYNLVYSKSPAGGGSGLFVTNEVGSEQELVTKRKAIVYALIF